MCDLLGVAEVRKVDEGRLVPFERGPTVRCPLEGSRDDLVLEGFHVFINTVTGGPSSVVVNEPHGPLSVVDSFTH